MNPPTGFKSSLEGFLRRVREMDGVDLVLFLSLIMLLVRPGPPEPWYSLVPTSLLAFLAVLDQRLLRQPWLWFAVAATNFLGHNVANWEFSDNHKFLMTYWCLAIGCSLALPDAARRLASNGRVLIGLVFLFATVWKLTSAAYMDDSMFRVLLVTDSRFFGLAHFFGGFEAADYYSNLTMLQRCIESSTIDYVAKEIPLVESSGIAPFATFLTWWTVLIEGLVAVIFLFPRDNAFTKWRHVVLIAFIVSTYPPTNVIHFGWLILVMGLAACPPEARKTRIAYVASFLFIFIFSTGQIRTWFLESQLSKV